jgi:hypothetical protein
MAQPGQGARKHDGLDQEQPRPRVGPGEEADGEERQELDLHQDQDEQGEQEHSPERSAAVRPGPAIPISPRPPKRKPPG